MRILTVNECGLVTGGLMPRAGTSYAGRTVRPDVEAPPWDGGYGGGSAYAAFAGGYQVTYWYTGGGYYTTPLGMNHPNRDQNPLDVSSTGGFYGESPVLTSDTTGGPGTPNPLVKNAVYGSVDDGWKSAFNDMADINLFDYGGDATINDIISTWSPDTSSQPNQTATVEANVETWSGLSGNVTFDSLVDGLHPGELENFMNAYGRQEGFNYKAHPFTAQDATRP